MTDKRRISVIGATGAQGNSVVQSLIQNPEFEVRCITRDKASPKAQAVAKLGVQVFQADTADADALQAALAGSWGVFINIATEGLTKAQAMDVEDGVALGISILSSAASAGVAHVVFSSAPYSTKLSAGKTPVPNLDVKARIEEWGQAQLAFTTFTPVMASWYLENFKDQGWLTCRTPLWGGREDVPFLSVVDDFGDIIQGIFLNPIRWNRRVVQCAGELMSWADMVQSFAVATGRKARFIPYIPAQAMPPFELGSVVDLFQWSQLREGEYFGNGPSEVETARQLKRAAWKAKGRKGRETMMTLREYFEREWRSS
ncbi:hypothetical protein N7530_006160 [Penicillium desertorum]|uniref:NmrA-like domain-containing protein n=1 Tax=Penicillium desertorum TaxID=1303715 RepID=A0A9X0BSI3_9EURO|nr:hypothetical protein N7530_006160 [Penicillium desertorum]